MSAPTPLPVLPSIPWYQSAVQRAQLSTAIGGLVALSPKIGNLIGVHTSDQAAAWVESVAGAFTVLAPIIGMFWRAFSKIQPLAWSKRLAAKHPANIAASELSPIVPKPESPSEQRQ
jgi:hypothetical protein